MRGLKPGYLSMSDVVNTADICQWLIIFLKSSYHYRDLTCVRMLFPLGKALFQLSILTQAMLKYDAFTFHQSLFDSILLLFTTFN